MRKSWLLSSSLALCSLLGWNLSAQEIDLKKNGAFGFPQADATVVCDTDELRLSLVTDATYLYVQAIVWNDDDETATKGGDGRMIGDTGNLLLDVDNDQMRTPRIDRTYSLNPWPAMPGLHYQIVMGDRATTGLMNDSAGRGAIKLVTTADGKTVRVDSFLVPLAEIDLKTGDTLRLAYRGSSAVPEMMVNSVGFTGKDKYYDFEMPLDKFTEVKLNPGSSIDAKLVPEVRPPARTARPATAQPEPTLTVGSDAPSLDIEHWVQNGQGKFKPVTKFDSEKIYIVEFWATWCGPCIAAMPHIVDLQAKYADKGLQVVSISDEELETVEKFLDRKMPAKEGEEPKTYGELTSSYCLTTDPDESCHESYMRAAGQNGIPCAFLVGKEGKIEWIGHPMSIDKALEAVLAGTWNREEYLAQFTAQKIIQQHMSQIMLTAMKNRFAEAKEMANKVAGESDSEIVKKNMANTIASIEADELGYMILKKNPKAVDMLKKQLTDATPAKANNVVWTAVCAPAIAGRKVDEQLFAVSVDAMEKAVDAEPKSSYYLDTLAHLFDLQGKLDQAIAAQEKAIEYSDDRVRETCTKFMEELKAKKK